MERKHYRDLVWRGLASIPVKVDHAYLSVLLFLGIMNGFKNYWYVQDTAAVCIYLFFYLFVVVPKTPLNLFHQWHRLLDLFSIQVQLIFISWVNDK